MKRFLSLLLAAATFCSVTAIVATTTPSTASAQTGGGRYIRIESGNAAPLQWVRELAFFDVNGNEISLENATSLKGSSSDAAFDGNRGTVWSASNGEAAIELDLGVDANLAVANVIGAYTANQSAVVKQSADGQTWTTLGSTERTGHSNTPSAIFLGEFFSPETTTNGQRSSGRTVASRRAIAERTGKPSGGLNFVAATGLYAKPGALLQINVDAPAGTTSAITMRVLGSTDQTQHPLKVGMNIVKTTVGGVLVPSASNDDEWLDETVTFTIDGNMIQESPLFDSQTMSSSWFWKKYHAMAPSWDPAGRDVIVKSDRIYVLTHRATLDDLDDLDLNQSMDRLDRVVIEAQNWLGMDQTSEGTHARPRNYLYVAAENRGYMWSTGYSIHLRQVDGLMIKRLFNPPTPNFLHGFAHEMGHGWVPDPWYGGVYGSGEAAPNLLSARAIMQELRADGTPWKWIFGSAINSGTNYANTVRAEGNLSKDTLGQRGTQAILYQIYYHIGTDGAHRVNREYRELLQRPDDPFWSIPNSSYQRLSYLLTKTSGKDFRPYFGEWDLGTDAQTSKLIDGLKPTSVFDKNLAHKNNYPEESPY